MVLLAPKLSPYLIMQKEKFVFVGISTHSFDKVGNKDGFLYLMSNIGRKPKIRSQKRQKREPCKGLLK